MESLLRFLSQFTKRDTSSVLTIYISTAGWPAPPGTVRLLAREEHWFEPPTFTELFQLRPYDAHTVRGHWRTSHGRHVWVTEHMRRPA